jgi:hypothetical protein
MRAAEPRSLPIRVPPLPGEALDSWFDALAHRLQVPVPDLLPALGLPPGARRPDPALDIPGDWTIQLRPAEADAIGAASAVPADTITAMTLAIYDQRAVVIDSAARRVNIRSMWGRGVGSRYCPDWLTDTGGRWQVSWKLNWSFACLTHRRLLADWCPDCGRAQRTRASGEHEPPEPGRCALPVDPIHRRPLQGRTGAHVRCRADLGHATTLRLPDGHPALHAQRLLMEMFASGVADFGLYAGRPLPAITALADVRSVAGRAVAHVLRHDPAGILPTDPVTEQILTLAAEQQRTPTRARQRLGTVAPASAAGTAVGVIAAYAVVLSPDVHQAAEALQPLIVTPRGPRATVTCPSTVDDWGRPPAMSCTRSRSPPSGRGYGPPTNCATAPPRRTHASPTPPPPSSASGRSPHCCGHSGRSGSARRTVCTPGPCGLPCPVRYCWPAPGSNWPPPPNSSAAPPTGTASPRPCRCCTPPGTGRTSPSG